MKGRSRIVPIAVAAVAPAGARLLADQMPDAQFVENEHSGHFVYLDETERFARDVADFVVRSARR